MSATGPIHSVVKLLDNVRSSGGGWTAQCPAHHDRKNSLSVNEGKDGRVLLKCHAGCQIEDVVDALGLEMHELFPHRQAKPTPLKSGLTLKEYAKMKLLPAKFLRKVGVEEIYLQKVPAVRMPYMDADGTTVCTRMRVSMNGELRFRWKTGSKPVLYGLWRLSTTKSKYVCLVEGESDAQTLWLNRFPALGLPGAATWNDDWAKHFDRFERIYVVIEPDKGGETVIKWLVSSRIRDRVRGFSPSKARRTRQNFIFPTRSNSAWRGRRRPGTQETRLSRHYGSVLRGQIVHCRAYT